MSVDTLREITPYLTYFAPFVAVIALLDYVVHDRHKAGIWGKIVSFAQLGDRPLSLAFYGLMTIISVLFTFAILSIGGIVERGANGGSLFVALRGSGPLVLAVMFKILFLDFLLALKTFVGVHSALAANARRGPVKQNKIALRAAAVVGIGCDVLLTALVTGFVLNWWENFQLLTLPNVASSGLIQKSSSFFDELNFVVKETTAKSFYALNGTLVMYCALLVSAVARGVNRYLNTDGISKNIFKIIAGVMSLAIVVVATARQATAL